MIKPAPESLGETEFISFNAPFAQSVPSARNRAAISNTESPAKQRSIASRSPASVPAGNVSLNAPNAP